MKTRKRLSKGDTPTSRKLVAKRRKLPRGAIRLDPNGPILEQARERCR